MSEQARLATGDPKYDKVATTVPASGACYLYQINIQSNEQVSINMIDLYIYFSVLTGLTQLFPIHEDDEDLFLIYVPIQKVPVQKVSCMVDTILVNDDPSSGKYLGYIHIV